MAIIVVIAAILIIFSAYFYPQYQESLLSEHFNESLQNASAIETQIVTTSEQFNNQNSTDVDTLISTINNDITPKYSEELLKLNETAISTENKTEQQYLEKQMKRVELESKSLNATVTTLNAISQYYKGEKNAQDAQTSITNANNELTNTNKELSEVYTDIKTLLTQHPDLNQTLHDLNLEKAYYGEQHTQAQAQNMTNTTT